MTGKHTEIINVADVAHRADGCAVTVWPYFELAGTDQHLDRLWREYSICRRRSCVPDAWPRGDTWLPMQFIEWAQVLNCLGSRREMDLRHALKSHKVPLLYLAASEDMLRKLQPFAEARAKLLKAVRKV